MKLSTRVAGGVVIRTGLLAAMVVAAAVGCKKGDTSAAAGADDKPDAAGMAGEVMDLTMPVQDLDPATVLVEVDGVKLTAGAADEQILAAIGGQADPEQIRAMMPRFRPQAVQRFVSQTLLDRAVEQRQLLASEAEVDAEVTVITNRNPLPPGVSLEAILNRQGVSMASFRTNVSTMVKINKLVDAPTSEEVAEFYAKEQARFATPAQVRARHILVKVEEDDTPEDKTAKQAKAEELRKRVVGGEDFAVVAAESSDCPSKAEGGMLPPFKRGEMVKAFEDAAFAQATNAIGPLVESPFGYHVVQVLERNEGEVPPLDKIGPQIDGYLRQQKLQTFVEKLKADAKITYAEGYAPVEEPDDETADEPPAASDS